MTRYDPFAYGEVRLEDKQPPDSSQRDAEDMLFADSEPVKQAPPADSSWALLDQDVDDLLPGASPSAQDTTAFGAEILGEEDCVADLPQLPQVMAEEADSAAPQSEYGAEDEDSLAGFVAAQPAANIVPTPMARPAADATPAPAEQQEAVAKPRKRREVRRRTLSGSEREKLAVSAAAPSERKPGRAAKEKGKHKRRRPAAFAAMVPLGVCAAGGTAASWFWVMQANPVMAGIIGAATLVGALFSWLLLRG